MPEEAVLDAPVEVAEPVEEVAPAPESGDAQPVGEGAEPTEGSEVTAEADAEKSADELYKSPDGKQIPAKFAQTFKQHPELRAMFFENKAVRDAGGARALIATQRELQEIGGREGVQALEADIETWNGLDELFTAGDPKLVEHLFDADPEAAAKIAPAMIEKFADADPEGYSHVMGRAMLNTMQAHGVYQAVAALDKLAQENPSIKDIVAPVVKFWNTVFDAAQKAPEKKVDPEREKFNQEREAFNRERQDTFVRDVLGDAKSHMESSMADALAKNFKQGNIDFAAMRTKEPEQWQMVVEYVDRQLGAKISADKVFQRNKDQLQQAGDAAGLKKLYRSFIDRTMPGLAKTAYERFTRFGGSRPAAQSQGAKPAATNGAGAPAKGEIRLSKPPSESGLRIDWSRTPKGFSTVQQAVLAGRAYVKGRQQIHVW